MKIQGLECAVDQLLHKRSVNARATHRVWHHLNTLKDHDLDTYRHSLTTGIYLDTLAHIEGRDPAAALITGLLHDIGKIDVPARILAAPRTLTSQEWAFVKHHPVASYTILREDFPFAADVALRHHTLQKDPYPTVLSRRETPMTNDLLREINAYVRMVATADFLDAIMTRTNARGSAMTSRDDVTKRFTVHRPGLARAGLSLYDSGVVGYLTPAA